MSSLPPRLAARRELLVGHHRATVTHATRLSPGFVLVQCLSEHVDDTFLPGAHIAVRVSERDFRQYSLFTVDKAAGIYTVLINLASSGPGARWAASLQSRAELTMPAPARPLPRRPAARQLVAGDGSAIATVRAVAEDSRGRGELVSAAVEVPPVDVPAVRELVPGLTVLAAARPGVALERWLLRRLAGCPAPERASLAGHARSVQRLSTVLRVCTGLDRRTIVSQVYWADGKRGL